MKELTMADVEGHSFGKNSDIGAEKQKKKKSKYLDFYKSKAFFDIPKAREDEKVLKKLLTNKKIHH